jgi:hypothetical protein
MIKSTISFNFSAFIELDGLAHNTL